MAIRDSLVDRSPVAALKPLREDNARIRFLTELEEHRLRKVMDPADFELVEVAYLTGMRREEQFRLTRKSVNLRDGWITLEKTKNGDKRRIPMRARVREILARRLGEQSTPWVFPNSAGRGAIDSANFMTRIFRPAIEAAGIEDFTWHDLRHTACSRWVMAGVPLRTVQEFAGHKSLTMTQRYSHLAPDHLQGVMEMLDQGQTPSLQLVQSGREQSS